MIASESGIACNIFRLGLVWADTKQGRFDELQHCYRLIKTCLLSGYGIKNYRYDLAPVPVDHVARALVFLASRHVNGQGIFHICASGQSMDHVFERCNEAAGTSLNLIPFRDWIGEIKKLQHDGRPFPIAPLIEFYEAQSNLRSARIRFDCARTRSELDHAGIVAPVVDDDLLRTCLDDMFARDAELRKLIAGKRSLSFTTRESHFGLNA